MHSRTAPARLRELTSWLLGQASSVAHQLVADRLAAAAAHRYHFSMLTALEESGQSSQAELGRRCGLDRSDVAAVVAELTARGLVEREPDPLDRRRNTVRLTDAGRRHLRALDRAVDDAQDELLAPLADDERQELVRLLTRLVERSPGRG